MSSPKADRLVLGSDELAIFAIPSATRISTQNGFGGTGNIERVFCTADQIITSTSQVVTLWDAHGHSHVWSAPGPARAVRWSPKGTHVAVAVGTRISLHGTKDGAVTSSLLGHADRVVSMVFAPTGNQLVSASHSGEIRTWDLTRPDRLSSTPSARSIRPSPDATRVLTIGRGETARVISAVDDQTICTIDDVEDAEWSPDGRNVLVLSTSGSTDLFDPHTGKTTRTLFTVSDIPAASGPDAIRRAFVRCSPSGSHVAVVCSVDRITRMEVRDTASGSLHASLNWSDRRVDAIAWSDQNTLAVASPNELLVLTSSLAAARPPVTFSGSATALTWDAAGSRIAAGCLDGSVVVFDGASSSVFIPASGVAATGLAFTTSPKRLMVASGSTIGVWDVARRELLISLDAEQHISAIALDRNTGTLWGATSDPEIRSWRLSY
jgi:WD40 repeat protein